jgi:hypothetical protein
MSFAGSIVGRQMVDEGVLALLAIWDLMVDRFMLIIAAELWKNLPVY